MPEILILKCELVLELTARAIAILRCREIQFCATVDQDGERVAEHEGYLSTSSEFFDSLYS